MEDSLELPDDSEYLDVHTLLSPEPLIQDSRENSPPHSLAYSNSTCVKDRNGELQLRSPFAFEANCGGEYSPTRTGLIRVNNENHRINHQNEDSPTLQQNAKPQFVILKPQAKKMAAQDKKGNPKPKVLSKKSATEALRTHPQHQENERVVEAERKTISKGETVNLKKRVRELEQALHIETVISEELRTKLSVTSTLLQSKLRESGLEYFFSLRNSSRDLRNIDIFVEMSTLQKTLTEKLILIDRQKNQLKEAQVEIERVKQRKPVEQSPTRALNEELEKVVEEKESLMSYIDEQRATLKRKISYISELEEEINRLGDKESHYTDIERPKLIQQLGQYKAENKRLNDELETAKMELNLLQMSYKGEKQSLTERKDQIEKALLSQEQELQRYKASPQQRIKTFSSVDTQKDDNEKEVLLMQLNLLKEERDHYLSEYRKRTSESARLYALQLKLSAMEQNRQVA